MAIIFALIMKMFISFHLPDDIVINPSPSENEITICAFGRLSVFEVCRGTDFLLDICKYLQTGAQAGTSTTLQKYKYQRVQYMDQTFYFFLNICLAIDRKSTRLN